MCDYKKGSRIKTGVFFCDRVLVFASHIRYNDRKLFQRERRKTVMKKIVFATGNAGKMKEICEILADLPVEIYSMKEAGISVEIDENGKTFEENAKIKAQTVAGCTDGDTIVLADDSGLEVDALNGEPGVYSARYMGEDTPGGRAGGKKNGTIRLCDCSRLPGWNSLYHQRNDRGKNRLRGTRGERFWL